MSAAPVKAPFLPRRAFLAAGLSAVLAGGAVALGVVGGASSPQAEQFQFSRGLSWANGEEARLRAMLSQALVDDRIHVTILGHTGDAGDADANLELSQARAALAQTMAEGLGLTTDRITSAGVGGAAPLARTDGESDRAYQSRMARVEVTLQQRR